MLGCQWLEVLVCQWLEGWKSQAHRARLLAGCLRGTSTSSFHFNLLLRLGVDQLPGLSNPASVLGASLPTNSTSEPVQLGAAMAYKKDTETHNNRKRTGKMDRTPTLLKRKWLQRHEIRGQDTTKTNHRDPTCAAGLSTATACCLCDPTNNLS